MIIDQELFLKIMQFDIDGAGPREVTFAKKLAQQQNWTPDYTERVIKEYRRFLYLGAVEAPVSPSPHVDEVWHLHLTYTVSYWKRLCGEVLPQPFHHHPSRGGKNETNKYSEMFEKTLAKYEATFGQLPPADIWHPKPTPRQDYWQIPKVKGKRLVSIAAGSLVFALMAMGCASQSSEASLLPFFVLGLLFFGIVVTIIVAIAQAGKRERSGRYGGTGTSGFYGCGASGGTSSSSPTPAESASVNPDASTDSGGQSAVSDHGGPDSGSSSSDSSSSSGGDSSSGCGGGGGGD